MLLVAALHALTARCAVALALCASLPAAALQPLVTDDTDTQGRGGNQLEVALERERARSPGVRATRRALPVVYTRGLTDELDGYVEWSHVRLRSSGADEEGSGSGNPAIGFKWRLWEDPARKLSMALKPEVQFGVSRASERRGLGDGRNYGVTAIVSQETSFGAVHANLAAARSDYALSENRAENRRMHYRFSVAPVFALWRTWLAAIDMGVMTNPDRERRARMGYVELGAIWMPRENVELALGVIEQVGDGAPSSRTFTGGLTWRF